MKVPLHSARSGSIERLVTALTRRLPRKVAKPLGEFARVFGGHGQIEVSACRGTSDQRGQARLWPRGRGVGRLHGSDIEHGCRSRQFGPLSPQRPVGLPLHLLIDPKSAASPVATRGVDAPQEAKDRQRSDGGQCSGAFRRRRRRESSDRRGDEDRAHHDGGWSLPRRRDKGTGQDDGQQAEPSSRGAQEPNEESARRHTTTVARTVVSGSNSAGYSCS